MVASTESGQEKSWRTALASGSSGSAGMNGFRHAPSPNSRTTTSASRERWRRRFISELPGQLERAAPVVLLGERGGLRDPRAVVRGAIRREDAVHRAGQLAALADGQVQVR